MSEEMKREHKFMCERVSVCMAAHKSMISSSMKKLYCYCDQIN